MEFLGSSGQFATSQEFLQFSSNNLSPEGGPALDNVVLAPVSAILQNGSFETSDAALE